MPPPQEKIKALDDSERDRISDISMQIRQAIRSALPAPPEQFFTLMVPAKVVNLDVLAQGFGPDGKSTSIEPRQEVQITEAKLCDDMPALSGVQLGLTGRSVSRSYSATLAKLCPAGHTIGVDDGIRSANLEEAEQRYRNAMEWLTAPAFPAAPGTPETRIDRYRDKQNKYTSVFEHKLRAFREALERARNDPVNYGSLEKQRTAYDKWVAENQKTYNNNVQAAFMDWVTLGKKEEVEYYFSIVDNDSAMARVELSKEAMRNSIVSDGSAEYNTVSLSPTRWAWLAKKKAKSGPKGETAESLAWKAARLRKVNHILRGIRDNPQFVKKSTQPPTTRAPTPGPPQVPGSPGVLDSSGGPDPKKPPENPDVPGSVLDFLESLRTFQDASVEYEKDNKRRAHSSEPDKDLLTKLEKLRKARGKLAESLTTVDQKTIAHLKKSAIEDQNSLFKDGSALLNAQIDSNEEKIQGYDKQRNTLASTEPVLTIQDYFATSAGIPKPAPPKVTTNADYWTSISLEVSSKYAVEKSSTSSNSFTFGGSEGWGLWSVGGSVGYSGDTADVDSQLANSNVMASFDCMRVDITRSWLRGELFYDDALRVAARNYVSPGPMALARLMDPENYEHEKILSPSERDKELAKYRLFPMYPTAFLLAANVVLEIEGDTSDIQSHFNTSNTSVTPRLGWGPFAITSSFSHTVTQASSTCESTANGCKITIRSPQIIGWISEIVPALPKVKPGNATTRRTEDRQNVVKFPPDA